MAIEQHDKEYTERTTVRLIVFFGALIGIGVFIIPNVEYGPKVSTTGWVLITIWSVVLVVGGIWIGRIKTRYHCPKCRARLPMLRPEESTKFQHRFHCPTCDVIWTTDLYEGDL